MRHLTLALVLLALLVVLPGCNLFREETEQEAVLRRQKEEQREKLEAFQKRQEGESKHETSYMR